MDSLKCKFTRVVGGASDSTDLFGSCNQPVLKLRKYHRKGRIIVGVMLVTLVTNDICMDIRGYFVSLC